MFVRIIICIVYLVVIIHRHQRINGPSNLPSLVFIILYSTYTLCSEPKKILISIEEHNLYFFCSCIRTITIISYTFIIILTVLIIVICSSCGEETSNNNHYLIILLKYKININIILGNQNNINIIIT